VTKKSKKSKIKKISVKIPIGKKRKRNLKISSPKVSFRTAGPDPDVLPPPPPQAGPDVDGFSPTRPGRKTK
jgi:hypothetical protein